MAKSHSEHESLEVEDPMLNKSMTLKDDDMEYIAGTIEIALASLPTIFAILFQVLLEVINIAFVGNLNDANAVATVGLSSLTLNAFLIAPGYGVCGGVDALVSSAFGSNQHYL